MKNRDMPATPSQVSFNRERTERIPYQFGNDDFVEPGLTKREYAAIKIASGMTANSAIIDTFGGYKSVAKASVALADAIFDELEDSQ